MTKKRFFVAIAVILVMSFSILGLVACGKPISDINNAEKGNNVIEIADEPTDGEEVPPTEGEGGEETPEPPKPTEELIYEYSDELSGYVVTGVNKRIKLKEDGTPELDDDKKPVLEDVLEIVVPDTYKGLPVVAIGKGAFGEKTVTDGKKEEIVKSKITSIEVLGENMTKICAEAFKGASTLDTVKLPSTVTTIEEDAFNSAAAISTFEMPTSVVGIGERAFYGCQKIAALVIPAGVTEIAEQAFYGCKGIKNLTLPENLKVIEKEAFRNCSGFKEVVIPTGVQIIGEGAFRACTKLEKINIPSGLIAIKDDSDKAEDKPIKLADEIFYECTGLKQVTFDDNNQIAEIGAYTFYGCKKLEKIELPSNLKKIGNNAFENTSALKEIVFNKHLEEIGDYAFHGCGVVKLDFNLTLRSIGKFAFEYCENLENVSFEINLKVIDEGAFYRSGVREINVGDDGKEILVPKPITFKYSGTQNDWYNIYIPDYYVWGYYNSVIEIHAAGETFIFPINESVMPIA